MIRPIEIVSYQKLLGDSATRDVALKALKEIEK